MKYLIMEGIKMPILGLGTYKIRDFETCFETIDHALGLGYRMFDTAQIYKNEAHLGRSFESLLPKYNLKREDIFLITKIATHNQGDKCAESISQSMAALRVAYLDLVLIHWPGVKGLRLDDVKNAQLRQRTYTILEELHTKGLIKLIGVSNYTIRHLNELFAHCQVKPHLLQSEFHPLLKQAELVEFCRSHGIQFQAYSSLGTSDKNLSSILTQNELIVNLGSKYNKSPAQILLKWAVQQNIGVIPKSTSYNHLKENIELFDFELEMSDVDSISNLNQNSHLCWNPDTVS